MKLILSTTDEGAKMSKDFKVWSRFYNFSEVYEYHGVFGENSRRKEVTFEGITGKPHSDGGFRLRSALEGDKIGGRLSFSHEDLIDKLEETPCPIKFGDIGCYFVRVKVNDEIWDYIGKSAENKKGIADRLREHLIKIAGTGSLHHVESTSNFDALHKRLREDFNEELNSASFFPDHVSLAFVKVDPDSKTAIETVAKIEGTALAFYVEKKGCLPFLNKTDETKGLEGLAQLLD